MAFHPADYPPNWAQIRAQVLARANHCCEGTPQHPDCRARNHEPHPETGSRVVLTTAHMWDMNKANGDLENLRALCQRCHLKWDLAMHLKRRRETLEKRRRALQPVLFEP